MLEITQDVVLLYFQITKYKQISNTNPPTSLNYSFIFEGFHFIKYNSNL